MLWIHLAKTQGSFLRTWELQKSDEKVEAIKMAMIEAGSLMHAETQRSHHFKLAMAALDRAKELGAETADLSALADWIFYRKA